MKFSFSKLSLVLATLFAFLGCSFSTGDGTVPQQYLQQAQQMASQYGGTYSGSFYDWVGEEVAQGNLKLSLDGNQVHLNFNNGKDNDLLGDGCGSKIGMMTGGEIDSQTKTVKSLYFAFDAGSCVNKVAGTTLQVDLSTDSSGKPSLALSLVEFYQNSQGQPCNQFEGGMDCGSNSEALSYSGAFSK